MPSSRAGSVREDASPASSAPSSSRSDPTTVPTSPVAQIAAHEDDAEEGNGPSEELDVNADHEELEAGFEIPDDGRADEVIAKLEEILGDIADAILTGNQLSIPLRSRGRAPRRSAENSDDDDANEPDIVPTRPRTTAAFPGANALQARKFAQVQSIIQHAHQALLKGIIISKRNIYYQNQGLYGSQQTVDKIVDDLAFTLGLGRDDLNIVAAGKGMISGYLRLLERGPRAAWSDCRTGSDTGVLVPALRTTRRIDLSETQWILVIEKEATFRTLSACEYWNNARLGRGVLVTGKGYADLATRQLLNLIHSVRPDIPMYALVDYDPHGIKILRTFMYNSQRLRHEEKMTVPNMHWLGIRSEHFLNFDDQVADDVSQNLGAAQDVEQSRKMHENAMPLTANDRKTAVSLIGTIFEQDDMEPPEEEQVQQLQLMLMLNIKAEIQAVDSGGDLSGWLDANMLVQ